MSWLKDRFGIGRPRPARTAWGYNESLCLTISAGPDGIDLTSHSKRAIVDTPRALGWQDFDRITVFKRDRMTVDDICMAFERGDGIVLEFNEEMTGWSDLVAALPRYLDGVMDAKSWYAMVVAPAFEPCATTIYDAKANSERVY